MNTNNIKKYAPKARREFMDAVAKRLNTFGITANKKGELQIAEANLQGSVLQIAGNSFDGKLAEPRKRIVARSQKLGYAQLIEQVAYTWFNRLCAIRYMEIHDYLGHGFRVLSHPDNPKGFEIIDHAQDAADELGLDRARIIELKLAGNKDEELYRELLLGQCHKLHEAMPFLFDALDDETELLLPDNLTRTDSILRGLVDSIPEEDWQQVEVIGWLYQFYISEKKDQVIGKVVKSEDIPAATQLFTPNWIVKYLVQNSVGRQWLQTYPDSAIKTQMEYYIEPAEQSDEVNQQLKAITPLSSNGEGIEPETIKVLDPACGSGHILIEAYNVLKAIYEERGFRSRDIPKMILENNLYGLDIDDRAAQLSGFALMMMARDDDKRIFTRNVRLNVLSLQESNHIDLPTLWKALNLSGSWQSGMSQDMFNADDCMDAGGRATQDAQADNRYPLLKRTLAKFTQAKTFGSLIDVPSDDHDQLKELLSTLVELQESGDSMQKPAAKQLIEIVHQALVLSIRYDAVIANPPYMGAKGMINDLKQFLKSNYKCSKADLFAVFMERAFKLLNPTGYNAQVNMQAWMFITRFEELRKKIINEFNVITLAHLGARAFGQISGEVVQTTAWVMSKNKVKSFQPVFFDLTEGDESSKRNALRKNLNRYQETDQDSFSFIPGSPLAYWVSNEVFDSFKSSPSMSDFFEPREGLATGNNDKYVRYWHEVGIDNVFENSTSREESKDSRLRWFPYNKGGELKRWFGNDFFVVDWLNDGHELQNTLHPSGTRVWAHNFNLDYIFRPMMSWSDITSKGLSARFFDKGYIFDATGLSAFEKSDDKELLFVGLAICNSGVGEYLAKLLNPTLHFKSGDFGRMSFPRNSILEDKLIGLAKVAIKISMEDFNLFEFSRGFKSSPLISDDPSLSGSYERYQSKSLEMIETMIEIEQTVNKIVADIYGFEFLPEKEITPTLYVNPKFRFQSSDEMNCFRSESISELLSYALGCAMGRYSLDYEGLIFGHNNQDDFDKDKYLTYKVDDDGIIPFTDQEWFKDDATNRFREFIQVVWGEEHLQANLDFVAESLCLNAIKPKKSESALETIRRYLSTQFYKDHLKTYKKRPIYWLFSSGKQKAFECLVYLHRYNESTLSRMRTEYVTPLLGKYDAYAEQLEKQIETADSTSEANRFKKELDALIKKQVELREFDDKLKHYADMRISLDLDDGVKVNYGKFGDLLADVKAITGSASEVN